MRAHIQFGVVEYLLLQQLLSGLLIHVLLQEMEWRVGLLGLDGPSWTLLLLEDGVEVLVVGVVAAALDVTHLWFVIMYVVGG